MSSPIIGLKPSDLNPFKLALVSFGSLCGVGVGLLLSLLLTSILWRVIVAVIFLIIGFSSLMKNIQLLVDK